LHGFTLCKLNQWGIVSKMSDIIFPEWFEDWGGNDFNNFKSCMAGFSRKYETAVQLEQLEEVTQKQLSRFDSTIIMGRAAIQSWTYARKKIDRYIELKVEVGNAAIQDFRPDDAKAVKEEITVACTLYNLIEESFTPYVNEVKTKIAHLRELRYTDWRVIE